MTTALRGFTVAVAAMATVVVASNILVQYPVEASIGRLELADILTFGAFTYPVSFLVVDLTNRNLGPAAARRVVLVGFAIAVVLSILLATPRIAVASGSAFLAAQFLDIAVFDRLRRQAWWKAPAISSLFGSALDTLIFFSLAFAPAFAVLGGGDAFATEWAPLFGVLGAEAPRWVSWALGDFAVKMMMMGLALLPYRVVADATRPVAA
ncbi:VUT family protein [Faunimonas sp. B44]|uniref:VUT family protein n=1 Tax=Faunimonas sp. B44 TaxID=3461493 RepID=UPI00404417DB